MHKLGKEILVNGVRYYEYAREYGQDPGLCKENIMSLMLINDMLTDACYNSNITDEEFSKIQYFISRTIECDPFLASCMTFSDNYFKDVIQYQYY
jgi:hypothetical protein